MNKSIERTPLMQQYFSIKEKYPDTILLFRVGDFYETFLEDAVIASKILGIVLTKRSNGSASNVELAGFPHHALDLYLPKLIKAGYRTAICDQLEDPKYAKGLVQRGVTELVTPGLAFSESILDKKCNNYLASIFFEKDTVGMAFLDLSTGEFLLTEGRQSDAQKLLQNMGPSEVIFNKTQQVLWNDLAQKTLSTYGLEDWIFQFDYTHNLLTTHFGTTSLKGFGITDYPRGIIAAGAILHYLKETEHKEVSHITSLVRLDKEQYVWLDEFTIKALELITPQQIGGTALIEILDQTITPMGARLLKKWLLFPLQDVARIQERLSIVEELVKRTSLRTSLSNCLTQIGDLERLISKVAAGRVNPREMVSLKNILQQIPLIKEIIESTYAPLLKKFSDQLDSCQNLVESIQQKLQENAPLLTNQGGIIKPQVNEQLDALNRIIYTGKDYLVQLQQKEGQRTHIPSLKISYNRVFGYYLEVSNAHKDKIPADWIRKQTLTNAERYITEELKHYEENIVNATEQAQLLEQQLYQTLVQEALQSILPVQQNAKVIAELDCYLSFAQQACDRQYSKPIVDYSTLLDLKRSRHPVIERCLPIGVSYVSNDIYLDPTQQQIILITGPNMAGKSALLRQVALTILMAQIGSFVPAASARIGLIDRIFTRVGASDNLAQGASTFMVEMTETASIMHNLSERSLILMDEIGRGTSTYDGISIAWALVEYFHNHDYKAKTLFATHYHELNEIAKELPRVRNYNVAVQEVDGKILFLHKLVPGGSQHSFGLHVAQMAGMPPAILKRAAEILQHLSSGGKTMHAKEIESAQPLLPYPQTITQEEEAFTHLKKFLHQIDINSLTPIEALLKINEIKKICSDIPIGS